MTPFLAFALGTQDSSEALSVSCPRNRFAEAVSCFLLLLLLPFVRGLFFLAAAPHTSRKGRTHLLVGIPPGGRARPSAE